MDIWEILSEPKIWPLFLIFLGGYVMMRVLIRKGTIKRFSELEKAIIGFGIGFLFEYLIFYPLALLATFWWPHLRESAYLHSVYLFCAVSAVSLLYRIYGIPETKILERMKRIMIFSVFCVSVFEVFILIVGMTILAWHEPYILPIISNDWKTFIGLNIFCLALFSAGVFFALLYLIKPMLKETLEIKVRFTRSNLLFGFVLTTLLVFTGILVVPSDKYFNIFTPRIEMGQEVFSEQMQWQHGFEMGLLIFAEKVSQDIISSDYRFFAVMSTSYRITPPRLPLVSSIYIDNPSNTSFLRGEGTYIRSIGYTEDWKRVYVSVPANVTYEFDPPESKVKGIIVSFENLTGVVSFLTNATYWQEIDPIIGVEIDYLTPAYTDLGNQTWLERHTILIQNNSNNTLYIPALDYDRFTFACVNRNSTKAYFNGNPIEWAELVWPTKLYLSARVYPQSLVNVTVTFQTEGIC